MKRLRTDMQETSSRNQRGQAHSSRSIPPACKERLAVERMLSEGCPNTQPIVQRTGTEALGGVSSSIKGPDNPKKS